MDENKEQHETKNCNCNEHHHTIHWVKFALMLLALFLACYLAVYYVTDQIRHAYYLPASPMEDIDRIINEQDKMFEREMGVLPMHNHALMHVKSPIETFKDDKNNEYKMIINLKPFNNNPKNINLDVQDNRISVSGIGEKSSKNKDKIYSFSQSFVLPEKIDVEKVNKEISGHKYIITLPIDD